MASSSTEKVPQVALLAFVTILLVLSAASFDYARFSGQKDTHTLLSWNPFLSDRAAQLNELQAAIEQSRAISEFMVWPRERQKVRMQMLSALQRKQNLTPYHAADWQTLLTVLPDTAAFRADKYWVLNRAIGFNKWQVKRRPALASTCIKLLGELNAELRYVCLRLIAELPGRNNPRHLAKVIGVEPQQLDSALRAAGVLE